jgi:hypothetical protein
MYWANREGNNMANPTNAQVAPNYTAIYGFPDGAQHTIFTNALEVVDSIGDTLYSDGINFITSKVNTLLVSPSRYSGCKLSVQADGNVVLNDMKTDAVHWATNTGGQGVAPYTLTLQHNGNLVLTDATNTQLWASNTADAGVGPYKLKVRDVHTIKLVDSNGTPIWAADTY